MQKAKSQWESQKWDFQEVVAPWFLFLTHFRRGAAAMQVDTAWMQEKLDLLLAEMEAAVTKDPSLQQAMEEAKYPLVCFADEVLLTSGWAEETKWERTLLEARIFRSQNAGQEFFVRLQNPELKNPAVIEVYYKCLCLGFRGQYMDKPLQLREEKEKLLTRLAPEKRSGPRFCPKAYEHTDKRDFVKLPMVATARIIIAACALILLIVWASGQAIDNTLEDVDTDIEQIQQRNDTFSRSALWSDTCLEITREIKRTTPKSPPK